MTTTTTTFAPCTIDGLTRSLHNDLISWSVSAQLAGSYDCSVELVNPDNTYNFETYKYTPIRVVLAAPSTLGGTFTGSRKKNPAAPPASIAVDASEALFFPAGSEEIHGFGMIQSVDEGFGIAEGTASFGIVSFFGRLSKIPITSPPYTNLGTDTCETAIDDLIRIFAQIPAWDELTDVGSQKRGGAPTAGYGSDGVANGSNYIWTQAIQGESLIDQIRLLAEANYCELFVDIKGRLIMEHWKDARSDIDLTIPHEAILGVSTSRNVSVLPSRIKVQGRMMSVIDVCGETTLNESKKKQPGSGGSKGNSNPPTNQRGKQTVCIKNGVANAHADLCQKIQRAGNENRNNANVDVNDPNKYPGSTGTTYEYRIDDDDPNSTHPHTDDERDVTTEVTVASDDGAGGENYWMGDGDHEVEVDIRGTRQNDNEWTGDSSQNKDLDDNIQESKDMVDDTAEFLQKPRRDPAELMGGDWVPADKGNEGQYGDSQGGGGGGDGDGKHGDGKPPKGGIMVPMFKAGGPRGRGGGGGGGGGQQNKKPSNKNSNEPDDTRLECEFVDPDLQKEFGDTMETVENIFITSKGQALEIATRKFQRIRMGARIFSLDVVYSPALDVNKVVTFRVPLSYGDEARSSGETLDVTGLIVSASMSYDTSPSVTMQLEIEPFYTIYDGVVTDYIGVTTYEGCNEISDPCGMEV